MLRFDDRNRWYGISFSKGPPPAIHVTVLEECVDHLSALLAIDPLGPHLKEKWQFESYDTYVRGFGFGFNYALKARETMGGYLTIEASLQGGFAREYAVAISLGLFLQVLARFPNRCASFLRSEPPSDPSRKQLLEIEMRVKSSEDTLSAPLGGECSPAFMRWLETKNSYDFSKQVEEAMQQAWRYLTGTHTMNDVLYYLKARKTSDGGVLLTCPGNGCGVTTIQQSGPREKGAELECSNLDSPYQQLTLLAGLAALHDLADQDLRPRPSS